jgi:hypothetical protein
MKSPTHIDTDPPITVQRMPNRSASRPIVIPPTAEPSQASEAASDGTERDPPTSTEIGFSPTAMIQNTPNDTASSTSATLATTHEALVSMLGLIKPIPGGFGAATARCLFLSGTAPL